MTESRVALVTGGDNVPPSLGRLAFRFPHCLDLFLPSFLDNSNSLIDIEIINIIYS
jgi:hypothetical protein